MSTVFTLSVYVWQFFIVATEHIEDAVRTTSTRLLYLLNKLLYLPTQWVINVYCCVLKADDADTKKRVTYVIRQGPVELFSIDAQTGVIKTLQGLDYESDNEHLLIVGTLENTSTKPGATAKVIVHVQVLSHYVHSVHILLYKLFVIVYYDNKPFSSNRHIIAYDIFIRILNTNILAILLKAQAWIYETLQTR